jgi:hypothetical protein
MADLTESPGNVLERQARTAGRREESPDARHPERCPQLRARTQPLPFLRDGMAPDLELLLDAAESGETAAVTQQLEAALFLEGKLMLG